VVYVQVKFGRHPVVLGNEVSTSKGIAQMKMIKMDFSKYTEEQLVDLNTRLAKFVNTQRRNESFRLMMEFKIGDKVRSKSTVKPYRLADLEGTVIDILRSRIAVSTTARGEVHFNPESLEKIGSKKRVK
jgi:hypothetical protein